MRLKELLDCLVNLDKKDERYVFIEKLSDVEYTYIGKISSAINEVYEKVLDLEVYSMAPWLVTYEHPKYIGAMCYKIVIMNTF